jgi:hypothetical protein
MWLKGATDECIYKSCGLENGNIMAALAREMCGCHKKHTGIDNPSLPVAIPKKPWELKEQEEQKKKLKELGKGKGGGHRHVSPSKRSITGAHRQPEQAPPVETPQSETTLTSSSTRTKTLITRSASHTKTLVTRAAVPAKTLVTRAA